MFDRLLQRWSIDLRIFSVYLAVGLGLVILVVGAVASVDTLLELVRQTSGESMAAQLQQALQSRVSLFIPVALALFALGLVWSYLIGKSLIRQVTGLRESVDKLRRGQGGISFPEEGLDEFGLLSRSLNQLAIYLENIRQEQGARLNEQKVTLEQRAVQLQTFRELAREAGSVRSLDVLLNRIAHLIQVRMELYYVGVYLVDEERRYVHLMAGTGEVGKAFLKRRRSMRIGEVGIIQGVLNSGELRYIRDVDADYLFRRESLLPDTRSEVILPLRAGKEVMGVLDLHRSRIDGFTQEELPIYQALADQLTLAVQNARLIQNLQRSVREANTIYQRYMQRAWSRELMGSRPSSFSYDLIQIQPADNDLPGEVFERLSTGKPVSVSSQELGNGSEQNGRSTLLVPIMMYNQMVGVVGLEQEAPDFEWSQEQISFIEAITSQVALALDNARLLEEAQLRSTQLRLLQEITAVASSHTNLIELLDNVSQKIRSSFDLIHCGMFLIDPHGNALSLVANASIDPFIPGSNLLGTEIVIEGHPDLLQVIQERVVVIGHEVSQGSRESSLVKFYKQRGTETTVLLPLQSLSEVIGVASLETNDPSRTFSEDDVRLFEQISLQISTSIDVARSFEQEARRTDQERRVAEVVSRMRESLDVDAVIRTAVEEIRRAVGLSQVEVRIGRLSAQDRKDHQEGQNQRAGIGDHQGHVDGERVETR